MKLKSFMKSWHWKQWYCSLLVRPRYSAIHDALENSDRIFECLPENPRKLTFNFGIQSKIRQQIDSGVGWLSDDPSHRVFNSKGQPGQKGHSPTFMVKSQEIAATLQKGRECSGSKSGWENNFCTSGFRPSLSEYLLNSAKYAC